MTSLARFTFVLLALTACDFGRDRDHRPGPFVTAVTWDSGTRDVPVGSGPVPVWAGVDVWFDTFLDPDSVTPVSVRLESNSIVLRSAILYDPLDRRVRVTPARTLDPTLAYHVVVTEDVRTLGGVGATPFQGELTTGPAGEEAPPERAPIGWREAEPLVAGSCGTTACHGDDETSDTCGPAAPWSIAVGLELDSPDAIQATAIDVRAREWPAWARIEPGRPDRSYLVYKLVDFGEEVIAGYVMRTASERGAGFDANGDTLPGACCAVEDLPRLHPPPWAAPDGPRDPDALRKRSLAWRTPSVWACACADVRGRFDPPPGRCNVVEGDCADGRDGDEDGQVDCDDPDCHFAEECPHERSCEDGADEDADGDADCADRDCAAAPVCAGAPDTPEVEAACSDGADDDGDGEVDCDDFDCAFVQACFAGLERPEAEPVSTCRARGVSDWVLDGAALGAGRGVCERVCAARCDAAVPYVDCLGTCLDAPFDASAVACVRAALCAAAGGPAPVVDAGGHLRLGQAGCTATCEGGTVVGCMADGAGESSACAASCEASCASVADACSSLATCGLGGG